MALVLNTLRSTAPSELPAGMFPVICVELTRVTPVRSPAPNRTLSIGVGKLEPMIVTGSPPDNPPLGGLTLLTIMGELYEKQVLHVALPAPPAYTVSVAKPEVDAAGVVPVSRVPLTRTTLVS